MIRDEDGGVLAAARAIAAGQPVDWAALESNPEISESMAVVLRELKVVAEIAELHRSFDGPTSALFAGSALETSISLETATVTGTPETAAWGPLRLLERVGHGAFGDVYRAWDPRLDREVALKLLKRLESRADSVGSAVIDEGRLLARVRHPNVVTVYGADRIDGQVGLWMEFVQGRTLEVVLHDHGPFGAQEATAVGLDLCRALAAVHRAGLIHRDIKCQNVVRESGGRIVLMDFGAGREHDPGSPPELAGTPLYLAPEVFAGAAATPRSDIYSIGVVLFHLVTGSYPIKGRTVADIRDAHLTRQRGWLRDERPDLPDGFVHAVERALEFDPDRRYESAGAMQSALARLVSPASETSTEATRETGAQLPGVERARRQSVGRRAVIAAALALGVGVTAVLVPSRWYGTWFGRGGSPPRQGVTASVRDDSSVIVRKVQLPPELTLVGQPSVDGRLISVRDENGNLAVVDVPTGQLRRVTTDATFDGEGQFAEFSAISPDNQMIAYAWHALDGKFELRVIDVDGKRPRVLVRTDALDYPMPVEWSKDGKWILTILTRPDFSHQLALVSPVDGAVRGVKELGAAHPEYASLSPDGQFIVYDRPQQPSATASDVYIVRADGSDDRRLVESPAADVDPIWTPDGRHVLFASDRSGTMDLWSVAVTGGIAHGDPEVVHRNIGRMWLRGLTAAGSYYYYATVGTVDIYDAELRAAAVTNTKLLSATYSGSNISSLWSPDGRYVAYASRRGSPGTARMGTSLAIRDLAANEQRELVPAMNSFLLRAWSPDGRQVLVGGADKSGRTGAYTIDVSTGRVAPVPDRCQPSAPTRLDWIADGRVVYFSSARQGLLACDLQSGVSQVLVDVRKDHLGIIGNVNGRGYRLSPDGHTLAYTTATREGDASVLSLWIKMLDGGATHELARVSAPEWLLFQDWTPDGASLLFTRWTAQPNQPASLWRVPIHGGDPQPLGLALQGLRDVSVHPDGSRITFTAGWPMNELWVMEHFLKDK